jgi:hypothetical protein
MSDPRFIDIDNLDHAEDIATALGQMVVAWAKAEVILSMCFARVMGIEPNRAFSPFYRIPTFESRVKVILAMIDGWGKTPYDKDKIRGLVEKISAQSEARNSWVHGIWSKNDANDDTVIFRFRKPTGKGRMMPIRVQDIHNHLIALRATVEELGRIVVPNEFVPHSSEVSGNHAPVSPVAKGRVGAKRK